MSEWQEIRDATLDADPRAQAEYLRLQNRMRVIRPVIVERERRKWSQRTLAEHAGMKQPAVARFERGETEPRLDTVIALYDALDLELRPGPKKRPRSRQTT